MLQTRNGKRTGAAMVKMAVDMYEENLLDEKSAILRVEPNKLDELLHPVFDIKAIRAKATPDANIPIKVRLKPNCTMGLPNSKVSCQEMAIGSNETFEVK